MRKSIDGLCAVVVEQLKIEMDSPSIYIFCGKRCDRIKILLKETDGFILQLRISIEHEFSCFRQR